MRQNRTLLTLAAVLKVASSSGLRPVPMLSPSASMKRDLRQTTIPACMPSPVRRTTSALCTDVCGGRVETSGSLGREMVAEAVGTFLLVQLGTASVMSAIYTNSLTGLFPIAVVWAFAVTIAIFCTASISGAHLNPAISVAFALIRSKESSFGWGKVVPYCLSQLLGATLGSYVNLVMYASTIRQFEATNGILRSSVSAVASAKAFGEYFSAPVTVVQAFLAEAVGTAVLAGVIFALTHPRNSTTSKNSFVVPPLIGITVGALICTIAPLTQAGFNPARDFGPRVVAYLAGWSDAVAFRKAWVYITAPILGAVVGAGFVDFIVYRTKQ